MPPPKGLEEWADYLASVGDNQGLDETIPSLYEAAKEALSAYAASVRQDEHQAQAALKWICDEIYGNDCLQTCDSIAHDEKCLATNLKEALESKIMVARQAEREACAKIAEAFQDIYDPRRKQRIKVAAAIRAREP